MKIFKKEKHHGREDEYTFILVNYCKTIYSYDYWSYVQNSQNKFMHNMLVTYFSNSFCDFLTSKKSNDYIYFNKIYKLR